MYMPYEMSLRNGKRRTNAPDTMIAYASGNAAISR